MSFPSQNTPKSMSPRPPSWFQGGRFAAGGNARDGREGLGEGRREEGKGGKGRNGKGGAKGKVGGIAPWLLGG